MTLKEWIEASDIAVREAHGSIKIVRRARGFYPLSLERARAARILGVLETLKKIASEEKFPRSMRVNSRSKAIAVVQLELKQALESKKRQLELEAKAKREDKKERNLSRRLAKAVNTLSQKLAYGPQLTSCLAQEESLPSTQSNQISALEKQSIKDALISPQENEHVDGGFLSLFADTPLAPEPHSGLDDSGPYPNRELDPLDEEPYQISIEDSLNDDPFKEFFDSNNEELV